jgi:hypothetical protein
LNYFIFQTLIEETKIERKNYTNSDKTKLIKKNLRIENENLARRRSSKRKEMLLQVEIYLYIGIHRCRFV